MITVNTKLPVVNIKQGEVYVAENPSLISTILGSCISVTLFSRQLSIGAMCHGFLPTYKQNYPGRCKTGNSLMYVDHSVKKMLQEFVQRGIKRNEIEVKLFGGAEMLIPHNINTDNISIAQKNIKSAMHVIHSAGLKLLNLDVGGPWGRKLIFNTHTGEVFLKHIKKPAY